MNFGLPAPLAGPNAGGKLAVHDQSEAVTVTGDAGFHSQSWLRLRGYECIGVRVCRLCLKPFADAEFLNSL
ncbi:hypothetical protein [Rhodopila sp.]|uniref:hypothetical protein n=1 Tax=Rhodopila sp. TaxID=2480087 RepID=UPI003D0F23BA